jgi:hypothetical protein
MEERSALQMNQALMAETTELTSFGWKVVSQTETTASLETRGPFSWWIFLFCLLFFPLVGGTIYILWWLIFDNHSVFLAVADGNVQTSGDVWLVEKQKANREAIIAFQRKAKEQGFWAAAGPSLISVALSIVLWFFLIWVFIQII